jgi:hypothetical protein
MTGKSVMARVKKLRRLVDSLGTVVAFHKLHGILDALEIQVADGNYHHHAVTRLCEALLATETLYDIPEEIAEQIELTTSALVTLVEDGR